MEVELLLAPDCPNAEAARRVLAECIDTLGLAGQVESIERVGDFASPTILVGGVDIMTGRAGAPSVQACRLDVPTPRHLLAALRALSAGDAR